MNESVTQRRINYLRDFLEWLGKLCANQEEQMTDRSYSQAECEALSLGMAQMLTYRKLGQPGCVRIHYVAFLNKYQCEINLAICCETAFKNMPRFYYSEPWPSPAILRG